MHSNRLRLGFLLIPICTVLALVAPGQAEADNEPGLSLRFLGEATLPTGFLFQGTEVGGLSGIDYDPMTDRYFALSDDQSQINPARFYQLGIDLSDGTLDTGDIVFTAVTTLFDESGQPFASGTVDPEAIRLDRRAGTLFWTSEGIANNLIAPFVRETTLAGAFIRELETPDKFLPTADQSSGIRNNLAFESLSFSARGTKLYTATENALIQDGPIASTSTGSPARFLQLNARNGKAKAEYIYATEPVAAEPVPAGAFSVNGLVEILAIGNKRFLAVERSFSVGVGNAIKIFLADARGATNVANQDSAAGLEIRELSKTLLLDLEVLGITLDNIEGITFGPRLPGGERALILVSDNNFNPSQFTQFLAFGVADADDDEDSDADSDSDD